MLEFLVALTIGQVPQAPRPPQAPPIAKVALPTYADQRAKAIAQGKPFVVFVRCPARKIEGCVTVEVDHLNGYDSGPNIVVGVPNDTLGQGCAGTLHASATDSQIRQLAGIEVRRLSLPFFQRRQDRKTADDKPNARQLPTWFSKDAVRYEPAKWTQSVYKTATTDAPMWNNVHSWGDGGRIDRVPLSLIDSKWRSPGGLDLVKGWASDRYVYLPSNPNEGVELIGVQNSFIGEDESGYVRSKQGERAYVRSFAVGTWFADVLSNNGDVFEVRFSEKMDDGWKFTATTVNAKARPKGYATVPSDACAKCHSQAGSGQYSAAFIPGGDNVFSFPFAGIEK